MKQIAAFIAKPATGLVVSVGLIGLAGACAFCGEWLAAVSLFGASLVIER